MDTMSGHRAGIAVTGIEETREAQSSTEPELPRVLLFVTALTCGLFLALAVHIALTGAGAGLTSMWHTLFSTSMDQLKSALAWWAIGISGCIGSLGAILLLRRISAGRPAHRFLRLSLGVAFFCLLAAAGHAALSPPDIGAAITVGANLAAMSFGAFMAFCTAHLTIDRRGIIARGLLPSPASTPPRAGADEKASAGSAGFATVR